MERGCRGAPPGISVPPCLYTPASSSPPHTAHLPCAHPTAPQPNSLVVKSKDTDSKRANPPSTLHCALRAVCHSHAVPRNHRRHGHAPHAHRLAIWLPHRASYASRLMPPRHPPARGSVLQTHLRRRSWPFSRRRPALPRLSLPLSACPLSLTSWLPSSGNSEGRCKKITPKARPRRAHADCRGAAAPAASASALFFLLTTVRVLTGADSGTPAKPSTTNVPLLPPAAGAPMRPADPHSPRSVLNARAVSAGMECHAPRGLQQLQIYEY